MKSNRRGLEHQVCKVLLFATMTVACVAALGPGCGGSSSTTIETDGGPDSTTPDSGHEDAGHDTGMNAMDTGSDSTTPPVDSGVDTGMDTGIDAGADTGVDAGVDSGVDSGLDASDASTANCTGTETACMNNGTDGLCVNGICSACSVPTDDANCKAAYPPASICLAGACTPGNCRVDTDCTPAGEICGAQQPNFCGGCTTDTQCQADPTYGNGYVCNTTTTPGTCVANTNLCTGGNDKAYPVNGHDYCCGGACVAGNCCQISDCTGNQTCQNHTCSTCTSVINFKYYVDPANGDDSAATGNSATGGACDFKTITRALEFIGPNPVVATTVEVLSAVTSPTETFPIIVPQNVTIEGASNTAVNVTLPANVTGFHLGATTSGLNNLVIDGAMAAGTSGILVQAGSTASTQITNVQVQNMAGNGINAAGGQVTIGGGTSSHNNGTTAAPASGLSIYGNAKVTITVNTGGTAAAFNNNTEHGILVQAGGSVNIGGTLAPAVIASANVLSGLYIIQTPGTAVPPNVVSNFQALGSTNGNGIHVFGGSSLTLRASQTQNNKDDGIIIQTYDVGATQNNDVSQIDLGDTTQNGGNTFQYATGAGPNGGAGICLTLTATASQTLNAVGNIFEAANCANAATTLVRSATCTGGADYGITGAGTTNTILLTKCM